MFRYSKVNLDPDTVVFYQSEKEKSSLKTLHCWISRNIQQSIGGKTHPLNKGRLEYLDWKHQGNYTFEF